jgi:hypothetical protein
MAYTITGTLTFSNQSTRDAALTRLNTALSGYTYTNWASTFTAGVATPTTTTITISIQDGENGETAKAIGEALLAAAVAGTRHSSGYLSVNKV